MFYACSYNIYGLLKCQELFYIEKIKGNSSLPSRTEPSCPKGVKLEVEG